MLEINRELLPMKGHYFLFNAGTAPLVPYLSSYARQLGFSSAVVGFIYTILPITGLIAKPLFGAIADRFQKQKTLFIFFIVVTVVTFFGIYFIPQPAASTSVKMACGDGETFLNACFHNETSVDQCSADRVIAENQTAYCEMACDMSTPAMWQTICEYWLVPDYCFRNKQTFEFTTRIKKANTVVEGSCVNLFTDEIFLSDGLSYKPTCHKTDNYPYYDSKCKLYCPDKRIDNLINGSEVDISCRDTTTHFTICSDTNLAVFKDDIVKENDTVECEATCTTTDQYQWIEICIGWGADKAPECLPVTYKGQPLPTKLNFTAQIPLERTDQENQCVYFKMAQALFPDGTHHYPRCPHNFQTYCNISCDNSLMNEMLEKIDSSNDTNANEFNSTFWWFFMLMIGSWIGQAVVVSIADAICFDMLGNRPSEYGRQRMWGSVGWGIFSLLTGTLIDLFSDGSATKNYTVAFVIMFVMLSLDAIVSYTIKYKPSKMSVSIVRDVGVLLWSPHTIVFLVWTVAVGLCTGLLWQFLFWHLEDVAIAYGCSTTGWIKTLQGLVSAIQSFGGEIPFLFLSGSILKRIGHINTMSFVLLGFGVRFILYSILQNPWWVLPIELLQGVTFGMFYPTMTSYASVVAPPGTEATVQGVVGAVFEGIGTSLGSFIGGRIYDQNGGSRTFFWFGSFALVACVVHCAVQYLLGQYKKTTFTGGQGDFPSIIRYAAPTDAIQMLDEHSYRS